MVQYFLHIYLFEMFKFKIKNIITCIQNQPIRSTNYSSHPIVKLHNSRIVLLDLVVVGYTVNQMKLKTQDYDHQLKHVH